MLSIIIDIQDIKDFEISFVSKRNLRYVQGYILNAVMAPYSMVSLKF